MSIEELKKDASAAHAVFDLCNIRKSNRGTMPLSLRMRALMLAKLAGVKLTQDQVEEHLQWPS